jgi:23S rRNA (pseudouridine1915-N3)-methyltransferase
MKLSLLLNGKTEDPASRELLSVFTRRIPHYISFSVTEIPSPKVSGGNPQIIREKEAALMKKYLQSGDVVILLDEKGRELSSTGLAAFLQSKMNAGTRNLVFITGGPFGFDESIYKIADDQISLSRMTFPHQLIRIMFAEQLYRALSILRNESYHHS